MSEKTCSTCMETKFPVATLWCGCPWARYVVLQGTEQVWLPPVWNRIKMRRKIMEEVQRIHPMTLDLFNS